MRVVPYRFIAILLCVIFFALSISAVHDHSPTIDELSHVASGYAYLKTGRLVLNPEHPPLVKDIAALPLVFLHPFFEIDTARDSAISQWDLGRDLFFHWGNNPEALMWSARIAVASVNTLLLFFVWLTVARAWNERSATIGVALLTTSPLLLGHGALVTMDVMTSLFQAIACAATAWWVTALMQKKQSMHVGAFVVMSASGALLTKFSSLVLMPVLFVSSLLFMLHHLQSVSEFRKWMKEGVLISVCILLVVAFSYHLHTFNMHSEEFLAQVQSAYPTFFPDWGADVLQRTVQMPFPFPELSLYALGAFLVATRLHEAIQVTSFLGHVYTDASAGPAYFPVLFIAKQSLVVLALMLFALISSVWRGMQQQRSPRAFRISAIIHSWVAQPLSCMLWLTIIFYAIQALGSPLQIGLRHIMPLMVMSLLLTARACDTFLSHTARVRIRSTAIIASLACVSIITTLVTTFPYYLSYYNIAVGGTTHGYRIATDSNYDWGQDMKRLGDWVRANKLDTLYIDLFTSSDIRYYIGEIGRSFSITDGALPPPGSFIAVSIYQYQNNNQQYARLDAYHVARIGTSILMFQIPEE